MKNLNKSNEIELLFPELTPRQCRYLSKWATGMPISLIARTEKGITTDAVKKSLSRSKDALSLCNLVELRYVFFTRLLYSLLTS